MEPVVDPIGKRTNSINSSAAFTDTAALPHHPDQQRRGSTPALMVGTAGHKKLCRVVHGQRVVLGTTPPVFVAELRPSVSSEILTSSVTPPKSRSPLSVEVEETPTFVRSLKLLEIQDSDPFVSGSEHSAVSRNASEASTFSQDYTYSPTITTTFAPSAASDTYSSSRSSVTTVSSFNSYESSSDFCKLSLQDSGYGGSIPLCSTNSDVSNIATNLVDGGTSQQLSPCPDNVSLDYYTSLLDFTLKLGYSELQLKSVLFKLASRNPAQDKVLAELIKLGQDVQEIPASPEIGGPVVSQLGSATVGSGVQQRTQPSGLKAIVIDGSNVAMTHGNKVVFSCLGIRLCIDWFGHRGHSDIKVFVPQFRKEQSRSDNPITDQHILFDLEKENALVWTPSRRLGGRRIICHDDRYILKMAVEKDAIIVSNDEYRDMVYENPDFRKAVEERLLMYNFIDGKFVPPDDPLGRYGPKLDQFLSKSAPNFSAPPCPYGRKCTYGNKCKFYHPERLGGLHRSVTERLRDHAEMHRRISPTNSLQYPASGVADGFGDLNSFQARAENVGQKQAAFRTRSLNPATLLRQSSNSGTSHGRYSPPSLTTSYRPLPSMHYNNPLQRIQADSGHSGLSKQMSNPEAASFRTQTAPIGSPDSSSDDTRYLRPPAPGAPTSVLRQIWQNEQGHMQHPTVVRNVSVPGANLLHHQTHFAYAPSATNPTFMTNLLCVGEHQRKNSVSDSQLNLLGSGMSTTTAVETDDPFCAAFGGGNYYIPSTTVWGPVEHSSSPVFTSPATIGWSSSTKSPPTHGAVGNSSPVNSFDAARSKVYYHLSQLFPESLVMSVMRANASEIDPQKLCSLILAAREQANLGDDRAESIER